MSARLNSHLASNASSANATANCNTGTTCELLTVGFASSAQCSRSMNELHKFSPHFGNVNDPGKQGNCNVFAGPLIINDRILPDDEIGFKVVAKMISKVKKKIFNSSEEVRRQDSSGSQDIMKALRCNNNNNNNNICSSSSPSRNAACVKKENIVLQRMESRQSSTSQSKRDSIQSSATGHSQLKRFKPHGSKNDASSRQCSVSYESHGSREIVVRTDEFELGKQQYDRPTSQVKLCVEGETYLEPPFRQRSMSLSLRRLETEQTDAVSPLNSLGVPQGKSGRNFSGGRRMTSPSGFADNIKAFCDSTGSAVGGSPKTRCDRLPSIKVTECSYDIHGMTWDIYGADMDAEMLGELIQRHLHKAMRERQDSKVTGSDCESLSIGKNQRSFSAFLSCFFCSCDRKSS